MKLKDMLSLTFASAFSYYFLKNHKILGERLCWQVFSKEALNNNTADGHGKSLRIPTQNG